MIARLARRGDDEGVTLVFVMIFIAIVGVLISVSLDKSLTTTLSGEQLRDRTQLQYALDGGVERAMQALHSDIQNATHGSPASLCPSVSGSPSDITSTLDGGGMALNGWTVGYSCQTLGGEAADPGNGFNTNYAILTTDPSRGALTTQSAVSTDITIGGAVYVNGQERDTDLPKALVVQGDITSNIASYASEDDCNAKLQAATQLKLDPGVTGSLKACTEQTLTQALPNVFLPSAPTYDASASAVNGIDVPTLSGTCRVFFPGRYTSDPNLDDNGSNYFVSGLYYFRNIGDWNIANNADVISGARNPAGTDTPVPTSDCAGMTDAVAIAAAPAAEQSAITTSAWAYGSEFVFGGTSKLTVSGMLTMFSGPDTGNPADPVAVNVYGADSSTGNGYLASSLSSSQQLLTNGNATAQMQFNAKLFAPSNSVTLFASNPTTEVAPNGIVAFDLLLQASAAGSNLAVGAPAVRPTPGPAFRTIRIKSFDFTGGNPSTNVAVVTVSNFAPFTVRVKSWRTSCSGGGCL